MVFVPDSSFPFDPGGPEAPHPHALHTPASQRPPPTSNACSTNLIGAIGSNIAWNITGQIGAQTIGGKTMGKTMSKTTSETMTELNNPITLIDSDVIFARARARWLVDLTKTVCTTGTSKVTKYVSHLINCYAGLMTKDEIEAIVSDSNALTSSFVAPRHSPKIETGAPDNIIIGLLSESINVSLMMRAATILRIQTESPRQLESTMNALIGTIISTNLQRLIAKYAESSCLAMAAKSTEICHVNLFHYAVADKITLAPVAA